MHDQRRELSEEPPVHVGPFTITAVAERTVQAHRGPRDQHHVVAQKEVHSLVIDGPNGEEVIRLHELEPGEVARFGRLGVTHRADVPVEDEDTGGQVPVGAR